MTRHTLTRLAALSAGLGLLAGCGGGGPKLARVSGVVTLDGKPYPNAVVSFQPIGGKDNENPGAGSMAVTDASGRYVLRYDGRVEGAVVGRHRVRISTLPGKGVTKEVPDTGSPDGEVLPKGAKPDMDYDDFPSSWNEKSDHTFDVPPSGTDQADFAAASEKKGRKK